MMALWAPEEFVTMVLLLRYPPWIVWFCDRVAVSLISPRLFVVSWVNTAAVTGKVAGTLFEPYRPEAKYHSLSLTIGPPNVPSYVLNRVSGCAWSTVVGPLVTSNGVAVVQDGFVKFTRALPEKVLPPLLVIALTTPPLNRPNSAEMPEVRTCVSWIASSMKRSWGEPNRLSLTSTPLSMKTLSNAKAPLMTTCVLFGAFSVRPGESCAMPSRVLGT